MNNFDAGTMYGKPVKAKGKKAREKVMRNGDKIDVDEIVAVLRDRRQKLMWESDDPDNLFITMLRAAIKRLENDNPEYPVVKKKNMEHVVYSCPSCNTLIRENKRLDLRQFTYCDKCGKRLDWRAIQWR